MSGVGQAEDRRMGGDAGPAPGGVVRCAARLTAMASCFLMSIGEHELAARVSVVWNRKLSSTAGQAVYGASEVRLNPRLVDVGGHKEVVRTLKHELAHLVAHRRAFGRRIAAHGPEWREVCAELGIPGERARHRLALPRRQMNKPYAYFCPGCGLVIRRARVIRRACACLACCRAKAGGRYSAEFRFRPVVDVGREKGVAAGG